MNKRTNQKGQNSSFSIALCLRMFPDIKARHSDRKNPGQCSGSQGEINTAQIKDLFLLSCQSAENLLPTFRREGKTTYFRQSSAKYSVDFSRPWIRKIWGVGVIKKQLVEWESRRWSLLSREGSPPMKVTGTHVVSQRDVICRLWSHLGCSGWKANIFTHTVSLGVDYERKTKDL